MKIKYIVFFSALGLMVMAGMLSVKARAQQITGPSPAYLHALSNLRMARAFLADGWAWEPVRSEDAHAIREIDAAIREIKLAQIDDGKNLSDHPPINTHLGWQDRFGKASGLLTSAHYDLQHAGDVPEARGLRDRTLLHIDAAHHTVNDAIRTGSWN